MNSHIVRLIVLCIVASLAAPAARGAVRHVNGGCGSDAWSGASPVCVAPDGPKATIQAAINASSDGDEVVVADGTYSGPGNLALSFGGRRIVLRSAGGPDVCRIDCQGAARALTVIGGETTETILQGFTIVNGQADLGGAIYVDQASGLTVRECVLRENNAEIGGAVYLRGVSSLELHDCEIRGNGAIYGLGGAFLGGAAGSVVVRGCRFTGNDADGGGALGTDVPGAQIMNCVFAQNEGGFVGGGLLAVGSGSVIANCVVSRNSAEMAGGLDTATVPVALVNCSIANNLGHGVTGSAVMSNCIVWGNATALAFGNPQVSYSDIQGGYPGEGNINVDPKFIQPGTDDLRLGLESPCLDAGNDAALPPDTLDLDGDGDTGEPIPYDLAGLPRVQEAHVDMGAYEGGYDAMPPAESADDIDQGEAAVLVPEGGAPDPTVHPAVVVWNLSGGNNQSFLVTQQDGSPHPTAAGYSEISSVLDTETSLGGGQFTAGTYIAFEAADLGGADPHHVNLTYYDPAAGVWALAVAGNTSASPGHPGPIGDRIVSEGPGGFGVTMEVGDHGVYWDPVEQRGFAWANLDFAGEFGVGVAQCPSDCMQTPDGLVGIDDLLALIGTWGSSGPCDVNVDGAVDVLDIGTLLGAWGPCVVTASAGSSATSPPRQARAIVRPADIDGDGWVEQSDLARLRQSWGPCDDCPADLDADGRVDTADVMALFSRWGPGQD